MQKHNPNAEANFISWPRHRPTPPKPESRKGRVLVLGTLSLVWLGCGGVPSPAVRTATTSIDTQAQIAKAAVTACAADAESRQPACQRAQQSLDDIIATNAGLQAQAKP